MNTVSTNFMGGEERILHFDICPVDKFVLNYNSKKSDLAGGACKEIYELVRIDAHTLKFEPGTEQNAKLLLKEIFDFLEGVEKHLKRKKNIHASDHKEALHIGKKYTFEEAHKQTSRFISQLKRELMGLTKPPNAAEILDLDREEGMRSETVIGGCKDGW